MPKYAYNPLLVGKLDLQTAKLEDLEDVNTEGTVDGKALTFRSGTWVPETPAGGGDMTKAVYDTDDSGVVDNSERLEGETLASVRDHTVKAANISGTIADAQIPDVETLSYGGAFADAQIPTLGASKITSGTFDSARIPELPTTKINEGTFDLARIPSIDDARIPDVETLSYGGAFAEAQIPNLGAGKITSGTFSLTRIPVMDDAHIPDLETLSYGGAFADAQIPNLAASKITTGTFNVNRIETLDNLKGTVPASKVGALNADKITTGTFGLARIPTMDDAHIPDLETLSYGGAFATAQIPSLGAYKITSGTLNADRIPTLPNLKGTLTDAKIPDVETLSYGGAFAEAQIPNLPTSKITTGTFDADRIPILPTDRYGTAVLKTGDQTIGGTKTFSVIPILPASDPTSDNEAVRKAYVDSQAGGAAYHPYTGDETEVYTVSGTFESKKTFNFVNHGSVVTPGTIRFACELKTTAGSYEMEIIVGGGTALTLNGTESAYKLRYGDYGLGGVATGVVAVNAKLRNIGAGTSYNRLFDVYLRY